MGGRINKEIKLPWKNSENISVHADGESSFGNNISPDVHEDMTLEEMKPYFEYLFYVDSGEVLNKKNKRKEAEKILNVIKMVQASSLT